MAVKFWKLFITILVLFEVCDVISIPLQNIVGADSIITTQTASATTLPTLSPIIDERNCDNGHPCGKDEFCSKRQQRCRGCLLLRDFCNKTQLIRDEYAACEEFCIREERENQLRLCINENVARVSDISRLRQALLDTETILNETKTQLQENTFALQKCRKSEDDLREKIYQEEAKLQDKKPEEIKEIEQLRRNLETSNNQKSIYIWVLIVLVCMVLGLLIAIYCMWANMRHHKGGSDTSISNAGYSSSSVDGVKRTPPHIGDDDTTKQLLPPAEQTHDNFSSTVEVAPSGHRNQHHLSDQNASNYLDPATQRLPFHSSTGYEQFPSSSLQDLNSSTDDESRSHTEVPHQPEQGTDSDTSQYKYGSQYNVNYFIRS